MFRLTIALVFGLCAFAQKTTVNTSRSNIKSNIAKVEPGPDGKLKCVALYGKACTSADVRGLHFDGVKSVSISDGILHCDGKPCAASQLPAIDKAMRAVTTKGVSGSRTADPQK